VTLRARLAALTATAVALVVVAASLASWVLIRTSLLAEVDERLMERAPTAGQVIQVTTVLRDDADPVADNARLVLQGDPIGVQLLSPQGEVVRLFGPGAVDLPLSDEERDIVAGRDRLAPLRTVTIDGASFRLLSVAVGDGNVLRFLQPLAGVEETMRRIALLLTGVAGVGVALAAALGWVTTRAGLAPVDRLAAAAEQVAATHDLAHRIDVSPGRRDEVTRLATSLNTMLAALETARTQQRELVENASHELRTPLATFRNDLGLLRRSEQELHLA
jgi:two-component system, OmpR family, sensor histidine kinase MprB